MKINTVYKNAVCFFLLALLPPFMSVALSLSSLAPGLLIAVAVVSIVLLRYIKFVRVPISWINILMVILVWILLIPIVGSFNYASKSFLSLFVVIFLLFFAFLIEVWFERCDSHKLYRLVQILCVVFLLIGWNGFFFKVNVFGYNGAVSTVFPFSEPSYFAIIAGPVYMIAFFLVPNKFKIFILINTVAQATVFPSLTLLCYAAILVFIVLRIRVVKFIVAIIFAAIIFAAILHSNPTYVKYCTGRLTLSSKSGNLTSLAALQGIYAAKNSLIDTKGLGLGFQMLGTEQPNKITKIIAEIMHGRELSRPEGGFIAAKLVAELGMVGAILAGLAFVQMLRSFFWVRKYWGTTLQHKANLSGYQFKLVVANLLILSFFVEMFLRGSGYFSMGTIFFISSLLYIRRYNKCDGGGVV